MIEAYIGEIRWVGFDFAPAKWFVCDGRSLAITEYTKLFSLIGTTYGGDGIRTFALPNLKGRTIVGAGQSKRQNVSSFALGETAGVSQIALTEAQMSIHTHAATLTVMTVASPTATVQASFTGQSGVPDSQLTPYPVAGSMLSNTNDQQGGGFPQIYAPAGAGTAVPLGGFAPTVTVTGGTASATVVSAQVGAGVSFDNMKPFLVLTPLICFDGLFPERPSDVAPAKVGEA